MLQLSVVAILTFSFLQFLESWILTRKRYSSNFFLFSLACAWAKTLVSRTSSHLAFILFAVSAAAWSAIPRPVMNVQRLPTTLTVGQGYVINWSTSSGADVSVSCTNGGPNGAFFQLNGTITGIAQPSWVSAPPVCTWLASNDGVSTVFRHTMTTAALPANTNAANLVAYSIPSSMDEGRTYTVSVTVQNTGNTTWTAGENYFLGSQNPENNQLWGVGRIPLTQAVAPWQQYTFTFPVVAPAGGTYSVQWRMLREGHEWFGTAASAYVKVTPRTNNAQILSQNVPNNMIAGQSYPISIKVKNTGNTTWTGGGEYPYRLGSVTSADTVMQGIGRILLTGDIPPGADITFNFNVIPTISGNFAMQWRMLQEGRELFGEPSALINAIVQQRLPVITFAQPATDITVTATGALTEVFFSGSATSESTGAVIASLHLREAGNIFANGTTGVSASKSLGVGTHVIELVAVDTAGATAVVKRTVTIELPTSGSSATPVPVSITPPHLQNPDAGTLPGNLTVGSDGAANYKIDLVVPPGSAGLEPHLSLSYSSNGSNGMVGLGWMLGGLSTIHRCPKTIAEEGFPGRISFNTADRLCLDGAKLVQSNGSSPHQDATYWSVGAEYRTELESFVRVTRLTNGGFKAETKDGLIKYYGVDSNSAIAAQGRTDGQALLWALSRVEDRSGNYYTVEYNQDIGTGEYTPKQIRYGANSAVGQSADLAIRFDYEIRPDAHIQYLGGARNDLRSRLTHIRTLIDTDSSGNGGKLVRDYEVYYVVSSSSGRSLVQWIQVTARNPTTGLAEYLPKTMFSWGSDDSTGLVIGEPFKLNVLYDGETREIRTFSADPDGSGRTSILVPWFDLLRPNSSIEAFNGRLTGRKSTGGSINIQLDLTKNIYTDVIPGDLNGDGRDDLILIGGRTKQWAYCIASESVNNSPSYLPCIDATSALINKELISTLSPPSVFSMRNDGKAQVLWFAAQTSVTACELRYTGMVCDVIPADIKLPTGQPTFGFTPIELSSQGMSDIYSMWFYGPTNTGGITVCNYLASGFRCRNLAAGYGVEAQPAVGDLNGDGLTDFVYGAPISTRCLSTEASIDCATRPLPDTVTGHQIFGGISDPVGDGVNRVMFYSSSAYHICRESIQGWACQSVANSGTAQNLESGYIHPIHQAVSVDDSGLPADLSCNAKPDTPDYTSAPQWRRSCVIAKLKTSVFQDRIVAVVNGVGLREEVDYARGDDASVYRRFAIIDGIEQRPVYPQLVASAGVMVKQLRLDNGQGGWLRTDYHYEGAMRDAHGRGPLGFALVRSYDQQSEVTTTSTFHQAFPYVGMARTVRRSTGQCILDESANIPAQQAFAMPNGGKTYFGFIASTSQLRRDLDCSDLGSVTTSNEYTDGWGNLNVQTVTTTGGGKTFTGKTTKTFMTMNGAVYQSGLPTSVVIAKTDPDTGLITRSVAYSHNPTTGLRDSETIEPGDTLYQVVTTYDRSGNNFGLVNKVTQSWVDPACTATGWPEIGCAVNKVRTVSDTTYDLRGRFPLTVKNALGHESAQTFDGQSGARTLLTDPNKLVTRWTVNGFGRVLTELRPDGNETRSYLKLCAGDCPLEARTIQINEQFHGTDRIVPPQITYADSAGRVRRTKTWGFNGEAIVVDQRFDSVGRLYEVERPHFEDATAYLERRELYDGLDRIVSTTTWDEYGVAHATTTEFQGMNVTLKNPRNQTRIEMRDVLGRLREVLDSNNNPGPGQTRFDYDAFDNLSKTFDPNGNVIVVVYDKLGRRTDLHDPDLGHRHYDVDPLGQVYAETSPNHGGSKTWNVYDLLGRQRARYEPELKSFWVFDMAINGIGRLSETYSGAGGPNDYRRTHTYDVFGRPSITTQKLTDADYVNEQNYDLWGRVISQKYRRGADDAKNFGLRYNGNGYLARIERGAQVLWEVTAQDASARLKKIIQGNGLTQVRTFNPYTGRLNNADLTTSNQVSRLRESYIYDELGNVRERTQYWDQGGFTENFTYDSLNRLETSRIGTAERRYSYDKAGNILSKTDIGTYAYPMQGTAAIRPHAVQTISGIAGAFTYDNNGNLLIGNGRTATWTTFDMPQQIAKGDVNASFLYGPEHQRIRQIRSDGVTIIYAGAQEVETKGNAKTVKTYWPMGVGVEIDRQGATTEMNWTQLDRLGSPVALTDEVGAIREKLEYDAWGKRRSTIDHVATSETLYGRTDNRGFTGHEMLDQLDLVHMNGRVYDPIIGKFMSGDPLLQEPTNGQSYNRYSYVLNNPTNHTDPTGFCTVVTGSHICKSGESLNSALVEVGVLTPTQARARNELGQIAQQSASVRGNVTQPFGKGNSPTALTDSANSTTKTFTDSWATGNSSQTGEQVVIHTGRWIETDNRRYGTPSEIMGQWLSFNPVEHIARDMGASEQQAYWIGFGGMLVSNPKQLLAQGAQKATFGQIRKVLASAQAPYKGSTVAGHALAKHAGRNPDIWGTVTGSMKTWNDQAMKHIRDIGRGPGEFEEVTTNGIRFMEKRIDDGRGMRLNMDGSFKGFID